ncbi:NAD(P)H-dependent oxidoreductase [Rhodococcus fascians]|uniref:NADPH-dependent FMN reductase n=1 Tax=Rhodococcoides fascians TaxID=1828 RepID=UPI00195FDEE6|nr:NAD(P)H-dependent oxidoreductase [Rhodococcus fascians]MBM7245165.1 NAD(P)H-dependent oxidoreductase [Rhodococcus fascians]MBY3811086.1 NAD(P)H-dependent oxidoreductase [Rhodococcus fascians]MBY3842589.1 NAD(P)H-dependent oxidoreductase [Rhodococcus fascians]MBY3845498.1 NAD(P)H-dependent oxidoreductase [Rhodococcus fascians]MBY3851770.1 NAD(P)H-dependent oxidoreductase [Rhodococcus fascians]
MKVTVVAGNPKPASRTLDAAATLATALTGGPVDATVDVITLGAGLLGWGDAAVAAAVESVSGSDLVVVASPTFKATYTGVLKLFLDQFAGGSGLQGVVVVPLMLGAGPAHAMAPDLFLKHVLVELGATVPAPGLYLIDSTYTTDSGIAGYVARWGSTVLATVSNEAEIS